MPIAHSHDFVGRIPDSHGTTSMCGWPSVRGWVAETTDVLHFLNQDVFNSVVFGTETDENSGWHKALFNVTPLRCQKKPLYSLSTLCNTFLALILRTISLISLHFLFMSNGAFNTTLFSFHAQYAEFIHFRRDFHGEK